MVLMESSESKDLLVRVFGVVISFLCQTTSRAPR